MMDIIHSLGCGFAFAVGLFFGMCVLLLLSKAKSAKEVAFEKHCATVEERLTKSMEAHTRIADALERLEMSMKV